MSEGNKSESAESTTAASSSTSAVPVGPGSNSTPSAPSSVVEASMQSPLGQTQIPTQVTTTAARELVILFIYTFTCYRRSHSRPLARKGYYNAPLLLLRLLLLCPPSFRSALRGLLNNNPLLSRLPHFIGAKENIIYMTHLSLSIYKPIVI